MNNRENNSRGAAALQVTLSVVLLFIVAILFASTFKAASRGGQTTQSGFYPPLPAPAASDHNLISAPTGGEPSCTPIEDSDKILQGDPKQQGALVPGGVASSCGAPNACNVKDANGRYHYKAFSYWNPDVDKCVTATLTTSCSGANALFAAAYLGSFDDHNICTNLIGDTGSPADGNARSFSFNVPGGTVFYIIVSETTEGALCDGFKLSVDLCGGTPPPTPTPPTSGCEGAFTIGDQNATVGNQVYFWGAQWAKKNSLSGGRAPRAFKGYATCALPNPLNCPGTFSSSPGNTPGEPDTIPEFITVIVTHLVTKSGPDISGDIRMLALVRTDPGYNDNPGHEGTGTVVAITCGQPGVGF